jgi:hypothetical protein
MHLLIDMTTRKTGFGRGKGNSILLLLVPSVPKKFDRRHMDKSMNQAQFSGVSLAKGNLLVG